MNGGVEILLDVLHPFLGSLSTLSIIISGAYPALLPRFFLRHAYRSRKATSGEPPSYRLQRLR